MANAKDAPPPGAARGGALATLARRLRTPARGVVTVLMVVLFLEVTAGVVFRFAGHSLIWYDEVASILLAWLTFYGSALASVKRAHIGCPEIVDLMPWRARRLANIVAQVVVIAFFVVAGLRRRDHHARARGDTLVTLSWVPMNFVQSVIPISSALIVVAETMYLVELLRSGPPPAASGGPALADALH
jgi:TRAP-type C4-dicarboxylate transport system permease small subunit